MGIRLIEISTLLPRLTYPSTLQLFDGWREFGFDPRTDGYLDNQILKPFNLSCPSTKMWSNGHEDTLRRSMITDDCGTKTCEWFNSSPKLCNWKLCIVGESSTIVNIRSYKIGRSWLIAILELAISLILLLLPAIHPCHWSGLQIRRSLSSNGPQAHSHSHDRCTLYLDDQHGQPLDRMASEAYHSDRMTVELTLFLPSFDLCVC